MDNGIEIKVDCKKILETGSIRDYLVETLSVEEFNAFAADGFPSNINSSAHDVYLEENGTELSDLYDARKTEICKFSHPSDIDHDYGETLDGMGDYFEGVKMFQIDICVRQTLKEINEKYRSVIEKNPQAQNLREVIGSDYSRCWYGDKVDFSAFKSLREVIETKYTGKELMYEVKESKKHGFFHTAVDGRAVYGKFHIEINKHGNFEKHKEHHDAQLTENVVAEAIYNLAENIYRKNQDAVEKNVNLTVKEAIARENSLANAR